MKRGSVVRQRPSKLRDGPEAVAQRENEDKRGVRRTWCAGLTDKAAAKVLHMDPSRYTRLREGMGLSRNTGRES